MAEERGLQVKAPEFGHGLMKFRRRAGDPDGAD